MSVLNALKSLVLRTPKPQVVDVKGKSSGATPASPTLVRVGSDSQLGKENNRRSSESPKPVGKVFVSSKPPVQLTGEVVRGSKDPISVLENRCAELEKLKGPDLPKRLHTLHQDFDSQVNATIYPQVLKKGDTKTAERINVLAERIVNLYQPITGKPAPATPPFRYEDNEVFAPPSRKKPG